MKLVYLDINGAEVSPSSKLRWTTQSESPNGTRKPFDRRKAISEGTLWTITPQTEPDTVLFEGSRTGLPRLPAREGGLSALEGGQKRVEFGQSNL